MKEQKVNGSQLVENNGSLIKEICTYFRDVFCSINQGRFILDDKIERKIALSLNGILTKITNQVIIENDLILNELKENTFLKKLVWNKELLLEKYGHLIYSQNIRTISTQYKKILISKFGAEIKVEEKVSKTNITSLLKHLLTSDDLTEIKSLIKAYCDKYNLILKK